MFYISTWNRSTRYAPLSSITKTSRTPKHSSRLDAFDATRSHVSDRRRAEIDVTDVARSRTLLRHPRQHGESGAQYVIHASQVMQLQWLGRLGRCENTEQLASPITDVSPATSRGGTSTTRDQVTDRSLPSSCQIAAV